MDKYSQIKILNIFTGDRYQGLSRETFYNVTENGAYNTLTDFSVNFPNALRINHKYDIYINNFTAMCTNSSNSNYSITSSNSGKLGFSTADPTGENFTAITLTQNSYEIPMTSIENGDTFSNGKSILDEVEDKAPSQAASPFITFNGRSSAGAENITLPLTNKFTFQFSTAAYVRTNGNTEDDKEIASYFGMNYYSVGGYWFIGTGSTPAISTNVITAQNKTQPVVDSNEQYFILEISDNNNLLNIKSKSNVSSLEGKIIIPNDAPTGSYAKNHIFKNKKINYIGEISKCKIDRLDFTLTMPDGTSSIFAHTGTTTFSERNSAFIQLIFVPKGFDIDINNIF